MFDDVDIIDDELEELDFLVNGRIRQIYQRVDHFNSYDDIAFRKRFRLTRQCTLRLLQQIEPDLEFPDDRNNSVSPMNQLLTTLRFFSTGGHLQTIADFVGMHVSTTSRIIVRVSNAIARLRNMYISIPINEDEIRNIQRGFYDIAGFPRVIGAIDGTHIKILSPGGNDGEVFRNRKSFFSINAQMICDSKLRIQNVVARWPGSAHDATIYNNSRIHMQFENDMYRNCVLLGDSAYPNGNYLLTPLQNPATPAEISYNTAHIRTRNTIERTFGVLKRRFPILAYGSRIKLNTTLSVIVACSVLHNLAMEMGDIEPPNVPDELNNDELALLIQNGEIPNYEEHNIRENFDFRHYLINHYFANL